MSIIKTEELEQYARLDLDDTDEEYQKEIDLLNLLITAAEQYLINATGKEYPAADAEGKAIDYSLEKVYLQLLISYWYEKRTPVGNVGEDFSFMTKSLMLQLQMK
jgi:Phage QLRG family, putative DNA packaging.